TVHKVTLTTAQANKVVTVIIENTAQKGSIKIVKQDKESKKRLTGAEFQWKGYSDRKNRNSDSWNRRNGHNSQFSS
ncbi:hypothetical protein, partial [Enterococcus faecalis]|uniref:hypothetical protein n=1 Tax=Enterococcus faecalis TaxID=1351 RepID=UPI003AFACF34